MCGILAAGLVCLIVGLCVYFTANNNAISLIIGLFTIITGVLMAGAAAIVLAIIGIVHLITILGNKTDK